MKNRFFSGIFSLLLILLLAGCGIPSAPEGSAGVSTDPSGPVEAVTPTEPPVEKTLLALNHRLPVALPEPGELSQEYPKLPFPLKEDIPWTPIQQAGKEMQALLTHISRTYPMFLQENWHYNVHFFDAEKTAGTVFFRYMIGEDIRTNKAVTCSIENGTVTHIFYTHMSAAVDEDAVIRKKEDFQAQYAQEKRVLKENEEFISEEYTYSYNYDLGKLIYSYQLFYYEIIDENFKVINNATGSEYFID